MFQRSLKLFSGGFRILVKRFQGYFSGILRYTKAFQDVSWYFRKLSREFQSISGGFKGFWDTQENPEDFWVLLKFSGTSGTPWKSHETPWTSAETLHNGTWYTRKTWETHLFMPSGTHLEILWNLLVPPEMHLIASRTLWAPRRLLKHTLNF